MKRRYFSQFFLAGALAMCGAGCRSSIVVRTKTETVQTGLFGNNREALLAAFEKIEEGKTTRGELTSMGFALSAPNIEIIEGAEAIRAIFGDEALRNLDLAQPARYLNEYREYQLVTIPYRDLKTRTDRIYISTKDTYRKGWNSSFSIVLKGDTVMYRRERKVFVDTHEVDKAFLQGFIEIVSGINGWSKVIK